MAEVVYPNVWGPGQLFAFSGVDGETDWFHPFVGSTLGDEVGFLFHLRVPRLLTCEAISIVVRDLKPRVVAGDCVEFLVETAKGDSFPLRYLFCDRNTVIGETSTHMPPLARSQPIADGPLSAIVSSGADVVTHSSAEEHTALVTRDYGRKCLFAFSFSHESVGRAIEQARAGLLENLPALLERKLMFYSALPGDLAGSGAGASRRRVAAKACSVLKTNVESAQGLIPCRWTPSNRWPHRDMWLWDSCFHSFGYRVFSSDLAREALDAMLASGREDGFLPQRVFPVGVSSTTQPPLLSWAYLELFRRTGKKALIEENYPRLRRCVEWVLANRRVGDGKLLGWKLGEDPVSRGEESGMDNSPRFDDATVAEAVDLNAYVVNELHALMEMALLLGSYKDAAAFRSRAQTISEAMNERLWDEGDEFYYDRAVGGELVRVKTSAGFLPLLAKVPDEARARRVVAHLTDPNEFWTAFPVPSVARNEKCYELDMWRGPSWVNIDMLIVEGLEGCGFGDVARELTARVLAGVEHWYGRGGALYEFYDPDSQRSPDQLDRKGRLKAGEGYGPVADYNWTAACYLHLAGKAKSSKT